MKMIKLTKGFHALVDDDDFEHLNSFKWYASEEGRGTKVYAVRWERDYSRPKEMRMTTVKVKGKRVRKLKAFYPMHKIRMHRFVLDLPIGKKHEFVVDHLNGDGLDNCRSNLEVTTQEENMKRVQTWRKKGIKAEECAL